MIAEDGAQQECKDQCHRNRYSEERWRIIIKIIKIRRTRRRRTTTTTTRSEQKSQEISLTN
jgi:hypothetical protein